MRICASYGAMNLGNTCDFDVARVLPSQFYTFNMTDAQEMVSFLSILVGYAQTAAVGIVLMTGSPVYTELSG